MSGAEFDPLPSARVPASPSLLLFTLLACTSSALFVLTLTITADSDSPLGQLPPLSVVAAVGAAFAGRAVMIVACNEAVRLSHPSALDKPQRRVILRAVAFAQIPLAARDVLLVTAGLMGLLSATRLLALSVSLLDPFVLWSCFVLRRSMPRTGVAWNWPRIVTYAGFLLVAKIITGAFSAMLVPYPH